MKVYAFGLFILSVASTILAQQSPAPPDGPGVIPRDVAAKLTTVAYWRFEEGIASKPATGNGSIVDSSGNKLNATPINEPIYRPVPDQGAQSQKSKVCLDFNGRNQRVFIPDDQKFELTQSLTIEASVNIRSITGAGDQILFRGDDRVGHDPYSLCINKDKKFWFAVQDADGKDARVGAPMPAFGQWYHLVGILNDQTGEMRLYINGKLAAVEVTNIRPAAKLDTNSNPGLGIGNTQSANYNEYVNGLIDEVRISNTALAPEQFLYPTREPTINPNRGQIVATSLLVTTDDFVVDLFLNGNRVVDDAFTLDGEHFGMTVLRIKLTIRDGDWLVFNVANDRFRWDGVYGMSVAGLADGKDPVFVSETKSGRWSGCDDVDKVSKFIKERNFLSEQVVENPKKPSGGCKDFMEQRCNWHGETIWAKSERRNVWIKYGVDSGIGRNPPTKAGSQ